MKVSKEFTTKRKVTAVTNGRPPTQGDEATAPILPLTEDTRHPATVSTGLVHRPTSPQAGHDLDPPRRASQYHRSQREATGRHSAPTKRGKPPHVWVPKLRHYSSHTNRPPPPAQKLDTKIQQHRGEQKPQKGGAQTHRTPSDSSGFLPNTARTISSPRDGSQRGYGCPGVDARASTQGSSLDGQGVVCCVARDREREKRQDEK